MIRPSMIAAVALAGVASISFLIGRRVEVAALTAKMKETIAPAPISPDKAKPEPSLYQELHATDVLALSFADFYEALRSAPSDARKKWAMELDQMPAGPRRTAAVMGFYKLLIQFDPTLAIKSIRESQNKAVRNIGLEGAANACPGFAMPELAAAMAELYQHPGGHSRDYFDELIEEWMDLDPAAVARFEDQHRRGDEAHPVSTEVIANWAELDPKAAKQWLEQHDEWKNSEYRRAFIRGLFESDRPAAISYVLAHAQEPDTRESLGDALRGLYYDAKEEARRFVEALPDERTRHAAFRAGFDSLIYDEVEDGGDPAFDPRAVADWMVEFPVAYWKGQLRDLFKWSRNHPQGMIEWVEKQPPAIRDAVAAEYTPPWRTPVADVLGMILQVPDQQLRDQLLQALFAHTDGPVEDMQKAIAKAPLSAEQRAHLLELKADAEARPGDNTDDEPVRDYGSEK